jgi:NitT/TauT family transport system substrate-binding protein
MGVDMRRTRALIATLSTTALLTLAACSGADDDSDRIRVALGDIESVETLALFVALERVRERGVDVELTELADEDLANQAVVGGQADVGVGAPYALIESSGAPLRITCQLAKARFFPMADREEHPDWASLDGEEFTVHSRGSTTEALARIIEEEEGIEFGEISYVPGSEVRATALLRGNVEATVLDIPNMNYVEQQSPGTYHVLPTPDLDASDEVIFANADWLAENEESANVLIEEVLDVWRSIEEDPEFVVEERERLDLLADMPADLEEGILPYYEQGVEEGLFTQDCGGEEAARADFDFYHAAGQLQADPEDLEVEDFWDLGVAETALQSAGD